MPILEPKINTLGNNMPRILVDSKSPTSDMFTILIDRLTRHDYKMASSLQERADHRKTDQRRAIEWAVTVLNGEIGRCSETHPQSTTRVGYVYLRQVEGASHRGGEDDYGSTQDVWQDIIEVPRRD